jgi:DNA-directed RNA polymerase subunit M/transcription elongation factor TFIIS
MDDEKYVVTVRDNVLQHCPACGRQRPIYVVLRAGKATTTRTTACCHCSRILDVTDVPYTSATETAHGR